MDGKRGGVRGGGSEEIEKRIEERVIKTIAVLLCVWF